MTFSPDFSRLERYQHEGHYSREYIEGGSLNFEALTILYKKWNEKAWYLIKYLYMINPYARGNLYANCTNNNFKRVRG